MIRPCYLAGLLLVLIAAAHSERLPVRIYTTSDGLAHDVVYRIVPDKRGFLWMCTEQGLSRFDGYQFTNYTTAAGLPRSPVLDFLETRRGQYWVATGAGLYRFDPGSAHKVTAYRPNGEVRSFRTLLEDRKGTIWTGGRGGLFRLVESSVRWAIEGVDIGGPPVSVRALLEDRHGALWIGTDNGLYRRMPNGSIEHYTEKQGLPAPSIIALSEDQAGRLWVSTSTGQLCRLISEPSPTGPSVARVYQVRAHALLQASDGRFWGAGWGGAIYEILSDPQQDRIAIRNYTEAVGSLHDVGSIVEDRNADLWFGTGNGAIRIARDGFTTYGEADGLVLPTNGSIFTDHSGEICGYFGTRQGALLSCFDGQRFTSLYPRMPEITRKFPGWGPDRVFQDHTGDWWIGTARGLFRFAKTKRVSELATTPPKSVYTTKNGLVGDDIFSLHEDARGDLWIALGEDPLGLCRWSRATQTIRCYSSADGVDFLETDLIRAFGEDRAGQLWIGLNSGALVRYRDRFTIFRPGSGLPTGIVEQIFCDHAGRLWVASDSGGVVRIDDPAQEHPTFRTYTTRQGLPSDSIDSVTEDAWGRIYLSTDRGVCRLDTVSGQIKHYTKESGLQENQARRAVRDRHGALWFATRSGLARLIPSPERPALPPSILIAGLRIAGRPYPLSDLGEATVRGIFAEAQQNQFQIEFLGLGAAPGERLRYQFKLDGPGVEWSEPSEQRTVHLAGLAPGAYRFVVRALSTDGLSSATPAVLTFTIRSPIWQRWWFLLLSALSAAVLVYALYRYRVARLIELERVRARIATDLHDDIGSSLSQMAILSEVTREQIRSGSGGALDTAGQIAETARSMVDAMSDIVWSIDPRRDDLSSLMQRVRKFASDVLDARGTAWSFDTPASLGRVKLTPEQRRHMYLIVKEAVHNAARHAGADSVNIRLAVADHHLRAEVNDDGRGFELDPSAGMRDGNGLENMRVRAAQLRGQLQITSAPGQGTQISLEVPL